jgi:small subunit ribosomal protein S17
VQHPRYGKYIRRRTVCYVHDENNESRVGDTVNYGNSTAVETETVGRLVEIVARAATRQVLASTTPAQENPNTANP